jgi:hypothetical protein
VSSSQEDGPLKNIRVDDTVTETRVTVANIAEMFVHHMEDSFCLQKVGFAFEVLF